LYHPETAVPFEPEIDAETIVERSEKGGADFEVGGEKESKLTLLIAFTLAGEGGVYVVDPSIVRFRRVTGRKEREPFDRISLFSTPFLLNSAPPNKQWVPVLIILTVTKITKVVVHDVLLTTPHLPTRRRNIMMTTRTRRRPPLDLINDINLVKIVVVVVVNIDLVVVERTKKKKKKKKMKKMNGLRKNRNQIRRQRLVQRDHQ